MTVFHFGSDTSNTEGVEAGKQEIIDILHADDAVTLDVGCLSQDELTCRHRVHTPLPTFLRGDH